MSSVNQTAQFFIAWTNKLNYQTSKKEEIDIRWMWSYMSVMPSIGIIPECILVM